MTENSISAITTNPLGGFGLGLPGTYSSYGDMATTAMLGSANYGGYNPMMGNMGMMGAMGMMGMYNPTFMQQMIDMQSQMAQAQNQMEKNKLKHGSEMHELMTQMQVHELSVHDREIFEKAMVDGYINQGVRNLAEVIRNGDQDAICIEYDKLKQGIYNKFGDYFKTTEGGKNAGPNVDNLISMLYGQIVTKQTGEVSDLRHDIKRYGETAFWHGFNKSFLNRKDYHKNYTEETLSYITGTPIDNKQGKDRMEKAGGYLAHGAEAIAALPVGYAGGVGLAALLKIISPSKWVSKHIGVKTSHWFGKIAAWGLLAADVLWQMTRTNEA